MQSSTLSRTSSAASISSEDSTYLKQILGFEPRRTRRRFTSAQVMMLEQLFHQSSHPTREERETVAQAAGMEMKSVTIWFQNKRQTERKALHHAATGQPNDVLRSASVFVRSSSPSLLSSPHESTGASASNSVSAAAAAQTGTSSSTHHVRTHARTLSSHSYVTPRRKITPPRTRPSLDRVATRSESRLPPPRTPTRPRDPYASLWDNMPSSPLAPPASPPAHDLVEFLGGGGSRTLEWACAAARLAGKEREKEKRKPRAKEREAEHDHRDRERSRHRDKDRRCSRDGDREAEGELTEEDDVEAVTPEGSLGVSDAARWQGHVAQRPRLRLSFTAPGSLPGMGNGRWPEVAYGDRQGKEVPQDEDTMRAALALCGLGRRSG